MKTRLGGKRFFLFAAGLTGSYLDSFLFPWLSKHLAGVKKCRQV